MKFVNKYLRNFTPYKLASHKIWTVTDGERKEMLKLDWNEATKPPSPKVGERISKLLNENSFFNFYPSTYNAELLTLLSAYTELPENNIQYFASSDSLHEYIAKLYITVGDPVLMLGPTYDNFRLTAEVCGADLFFYNIGDDFVFDENQFMEKIDEIDPSLVYICNPNNPTGTLHKITFIEKLINQYPQTLFLIDEAYAEFSGESCKGLVLKYENILISRTMSKAFALANFRFGYLMASESNINYISSIRNPKNITTFAQEAAIGALSDIPYMEAYVAEVNRAKKEFVTNLKNLNVRRKYIMPVAGAGNFVLFKLGKKEDKKGLISYLENNNVFVRDVSQTPMLRDYCLRITIGTSAQMTYVYGLIRQYFHIAYPKEVGGGE